MRRALADRRLELGSIRALAAELGLSESATSRLLKRGPPRTWDDERVERFAQSLYASAHRASTTRSPGARAELERKRKAPVYAAAAQVAAAAQLERALEELEHRRLCEKGSWTPRAELARELGVTSVRLGRWLRAGHVPAESMERVTEWAQQRADLELRRIELRSKVGDLIERSKTPAFAHGLPGAPVKQAARAPVMKTSEGLTQSAEQSGYEWVLQIEEWSSFELIDRMCQWARARERTGSMAKPARRWIVTAFVSIWEPGEDFGRRRGNRRVRSPGGHRQFEQPRDRELGRSLELGAVVSSRLVTRGGLARAVALFRENMTIEHCDNELLYVHSVLVRNWRERTEAEKQNYRDRKNARFWAEQRREELKREAEAAQTRAAARAQALGRGRSRAGGVRPRGKKKRT